VSETGDVNTYFASLAVKNPRAIVFCWGICFGPKHSKGKQVASPCRRYTYTTGGIDMPTKAKSAITQPNTPQGISHRAMFSVVFQDGTQNIVHWWDAYGLEVRLCNHIVELIGDLANYNDAFAWFNFTDGVLYLEATTNDSEAGVDKAQTSWQYDTRYLEQTLQVLLESPQKSKIPGRAASLRLLYSTSFPIA
jgi:hypothetical protein